MNAPYKQIPISEFDYTLDDCRIAKHPLIRRDLSKILVYNDKKIFTSTFKSITNEISSNDLMVFNNTKVVQARIDFTKETGANIEVFLLNPVTPADYQLAFSETHTTRWNCIVGNIKRWKGKALKLTIPYLNVSLIARMIERTNEGALIEFTWNSEGITFAQVIEQIGKVPIPPYLNRDSEANDKTRYQTVYAKLEGSVAAPTAGLHFTEEVLSALGEKGVNMIETTLHVGAGTFRPVKSDTIGGHNMHTEHIYITKTLIDKILSCKGGVIAVGTTSLRTLESLYWLGVKANEGKLGENGCFVGQWDCYTHGQDHSLKLALNALKKHINDSGKDCLEANTQMVIVPGYKFRIVDRLVTNFHQPRSTLLLLVAAFIGDDWKKVYQFALENNFRFLSYGDSSILTRTKR